MLVYFFPFLYYTSSQFILKFKCPKRIVSDFAFSLNEKDLLATTWFWTSVYLYVHRELSQPRLLVLKKSYALSILTREKNAFYQYRDTKIQIIRNYVVLVNRLSNSKLQSQSLMSLTSPLFTGNSLVAMYDLLGFIEIFEPKSTCVDFWCICLYFRSLTWNVWRTVI